MSKLSSFPSFVYAAQKLDKLAPEGYHYSFDVDNDKLLISFKNENVAIEFDTDGKVYIYDLGFAVEMFTDVDEALEALAALFQK